MFSPESKVEKTKIALNLSEECIRGFDPSESAVKTGGTLSIARHSSMYCGREQI